jgi:hypothetical protein
MKEPTTNVLVPKLLDKTNLYANNIKNRVKIDGIFNEFDDNANINFKKFIKLSEQRYKSVKSGTRLNNILENQKPEYSELSNKILTNKFYNNDEIEKESKKLLKKMGLKENQDLILLRKDIISKTKDFTKGEVKNREKLLFNALKKRKNKEKNSQKDLPKFNSKKFSQKHLSSLGEKTPKINVKHHEKHGSKDELMEKKKYFDDLMKNDYNKLNENLKDYQLYLKDVERTHKDGDPLKLNNNRDNFGHTYNFSPDRIKLLTYKEEEIIDNKPKKKEEPKIDIIKLMRYTKRGNKKWFKQELKNESNKKFHPFNKKLKTRPIFNSTNTSYNFYKNPNNIDTQTNTNTHTDQFYNTTSTAFSNYKNTIKTVRNEATKVKFINENFDKKLHTMEGFFKINNLPKIEDYENILKNRTNYLQKFNGTENDYFLKSKKKVPKYEYEKNKFEAQKEIYLSFNKTYLNKKILWEKEDRKRELLKKKNEEKVEEIKKYLKEIKNIGRKPNLFIDPYSSRDNNVNTLIKIFNKTLTGGFYSKKRMEAKLNEFNNKLEIKEKEKKIHEEFMNKKICEEEKKRQEEDIEYQIFSKMKENLKKENNDEEHKENESIDFNYKMVLSKGLVKNKIKVDPYKEYKEFFEMEKEKQEKEKKNNNKIYIDSSLVPNN